MDWLCSWVNFFRLSGSANLINERNNRLGQLISRRYEPELGVTRYFTIVIDGC